MFNLAPVPVPDLTGRTVLVTGAGKGIGAELVRILHEKGANVYAGVYPVDSAEPLPAGVPQLKLDVTSQSDVDSAIARITADYLAGTMIHAEALSKTTFENALQYAVDQQHLVEREKKVFPGPKPIGDLVTRLRGMLPPNR